MKIKYSFKQFCEDTNNFDLLNLWDYDLNIINPDEISHSSMKKAWFKCPRGLHGSNEFSIGNITKGFSDGKKRCMCHKCNSIGQFIIDNYGKEYLDKIWSVKNKKSYFEIEKSSKNEIWLKCQDDNTHPDYKLSANNFHKGHGCPYCLGKKICKTNSFAYVFPKSIEIWSDKNDKTPYEYYYGTHKKVWFKCENNIHKDYSRFINEQFRDVYLCPACGLQERIKNMPRGENSPYWKGDSVLENRRARDSYKYDNWRKAVFEKDDYTCQCCGKRGGKLNAHHLYDFAQYKDKRYDIFNGITLCSGHHDSNIKGSFHNTMGTNYKTPQELEDYINSKRKELNINIPFSLESYLAGNILKPGDIENYNSFKNTPWIFDLLNNDANNHKKILCKYRVTIN